MLGSVEVSLHVTHTQRRKNFKRDRVLEDFCGRIFVLRVTRDDRYPESVGIFEKWARGEEFASALRCALHEESECRNRRRVRNMHCMCTEAHVSCLRLGFNRGRAGRASVTSDGRRGTCALRTQHDFLRRGSTRRS